MLDILLYPRSRAAFQSRPNWLQNFQFPIFNLKCLWSEIVFSHIFEIYRLKYAIPKFEMFTVKIGDFTSRQSCAILPSKMAFELRGQKTTWQRPLTSFGCLEINSVWRKVRQARDNEADIALLVLPISKVVKTDRSSRAYACINSPKIQLWVANGFNSSADIDTTLRIRHLCTRLFVLPILKNRVPSKTWLYSAAWRPKVLKWIGA